MTYLRPPGPRHLQHISEIKFYHDVWSSDHPLRFPPAAVPWMPPGSSNQSSITLSCLMTLQPCSSPPTRFCNRLRRLSLRVDYKCPLGTLLEKLLRPDSSILPCRRRVGGLPRHDVDVEDMAQERVGQMLSSSDVEDNILIITPIVYHIQW